MVINDQFVRYCPQFLAHFYSYTPLVVVQQVYVFGSLCCFFGPEKFQNYVVQWGLNFPIKMLYGRYLSHMVDKNPFLFIQQIFTLFVCHMVDLFVKNLPYVKKTVHYKINLLYGRFYVIFVENATISLHKLTTSMQSC